MSATLSTSFSATGGHVQLHVSQEQKKIFFVGHHVQQHVSQGIGMQKVHCSLPNICKSFQPNIPRCFLTEQTEGGGRLAAPSPPACTRWIFLPSQAPLFIVFFRPGDPSTELILAGAIALLVLLLACWWVLFMKCFFRQLLLFAVIWALAKYVLTSFGDFNKTLNTFNCALSKHWCCF